MSRLYHAVLGACLLILGVESHYPGPPPRWRCPVPTRTFHYVPVYDYLGLRARSANPDPCKDEIAHNYSSLITIADLRDTCLTEYMSVIASSETYAVEPLHVWDCYKPCQGNSCFVMCHNSPAHFICMVRIRLVETRYQNFTTCYDLPNPVFGQVDYPNGRQYFAYARYQCASGYTLDDVRGVLCDHDGRWLSYYGNTKKVQYNVNKSCILDPSTTPKELPVISNGYWTLAGNRSTAQIRCHNGYTLPFGDGLARLDNGEWKVSSGISSAYLQCVVVCPALYHIDHGVIHTTGSRFENSPAQISCFEEFTFTGRDATVICLANGSWTTPSGYCMGTCPSVQYFPNGYLSISANKVGDTAQATCFINFTFIGQRTARCEANRTWSRLEGSCHPDITATSEPKQSPWLSDLISKVTLAVAGFQLCVIVALLSLLVVLVRKHRRCEVKDRSSSDKSEATLGERNLRLITRNQDDSATTYDVLHGPARTSRDPVYTSQYDEPYELKTRSKSSPNPQAISLQPSQSYTEPAADLPTAFTTDTYNTRDQTKTREKFTNITTTASQDRTTTASPTSQGSYSMVDLSSKKPWSNGSKATAELADAMEEMEEELEEPSVPPRLDVSTS